MNKPSFEQVAADIFLLRVPFDRIYTSVFLLKTEKGAVLLDSAATSQDVEQYILPALEAMNVSPDRILCSHSHSDHCGGMPRLLEAFPKAAVGLPESTVPQAAVPLADGQLLLDRFLVLNLKGHTDDCLGILDTRKRTLLSFDSLQQQGVDRFPVYLSDPAAYRSTLDRLEKMDIQEIVFSHDYEPFGWRVTGAEAIGRCLALCRETAK